MATQDVRLTATNPEDSSVVPVACNEKGELKLEEFPDQSFDGNLQGNLTASGSGTFGSALNCNAYLEINRSADGSSALLIRPKNGSIYAIVRGDGSCSFAGNKAGFTAQGHFWCTTERGDTVMLEATVGGAGMWKNYTPTTKMDEIKDSWSEKNALRPKPEESSLDEPETPQ